MTQCLDHFYHVLKYIAAGRAIRVVACSQETQAVDCQPSFGTSLGGRASFGAAGLAV